MRISQKIACLDCILADKEQVRTSSWYENCLLEGHEQFRY